MAQQQKVLSLYRTMLRQAAQYENYTFRSYAQRRIKSDFHAKKSAAGAEAEAALAFGHDQLAILRRQVAISKLYPGEKSVMEGVRN
ncbi:hypothetical protein SDRG_00763 [Saprolegnia diclina VS20]|uniref:Complex 1 LYR protein domain-containing protein n=1 Tax=Saprolegnia diclina (strain VS20) TaxID=1156394 RepID=T0S9A3_SAPDV|nr:hypothetical protein SDRG_00763 [Saprolegnia diclina VS20]EQC41908.1 hypothetical protein SDRG_00763 [Saprolegnia diclina VS20]|eukprot:XP_008604477.1 hypothetical protein SDRG_00763 [Saprolegnia diclina VS20]